MRDLPMRNETEERDYRAGFARVMRFAEQAKLRGWRLSDRQLVHEILQRERAAQIREQSYLPVVGSEVRSASWNHGQADALRTILRAQKERYSKNL